MVAVSDTIKWTPLIPRLEKSELVFELFMHLFAYWFVPGVSLTLCCFVVYSTRRFVLCLTMCYFVLVFFFFFFFGPFSIAITSLGKERANLSAFRTFVRFVLVWFCRFSLPLGVWEGLGFVIVALPGLISYLFCVTFLFLSEPRIVCVLWLWQRKVTKSAGSATITSRPSHSFQQHPGHKMLWHSVVVMDEEQLIKKAEVFIAIAILMANQN